jgi:hypothetical protein
MPYQKEAETVVAMWRDVERKLRDVPPESDEAAHLTAQWALLRAEHMRLTEIARENDRPAPEPWPEREAAV